MRYIWPELINAIENRQNEIKKGLSYTEQSRRELDITRKKSVEQLEKAREDAKEIVKQARDQCLLLLDQAKVKAMEERDLMLSKAHQEIVSKEKIVYRQLQEKISSLSIAVAERIMEHSMNDDVRNKIADKFVSELDS
jgi:F-type H+-transporting ATPase subunit b